jgi:ATP-dependent DNA helicase RecG
MSETIRKMIALGESENLEFKASFGKEVIESLAAFANHKGGVVLVGVEDSGNVVGVTCGPESIQAWVNQVKQSTMPSIIPDVELATLDSKQVVAIRIGEFPVKPVACRDRYFKRVANSNHRLSLTEIANLHLQSLQLSWDSYMDVNSTLNDMNRDKDQDIPSAGYRRRPLPNSRGMANSIGEIGLSERWSAHACGNVAVRQGRSSLCSAYRPLQDGSDYHR